MYSNNPLHVALASLFLRGGTAAVRHSVARTPAQTRSPSRCAGIGKPTTCGSTSDQQQHQPSAFSSTRNGRLRPMPAQHMAKQHRRARCMKAVPKSRGYEYMPISYSDPFRGGWRGALSTCLNNIIAVHGICHSASEGAWSSSHRQTTFAVGAPAIRMPCTVADGDGATYRTLRCIPPSRSTSCDKWFLHGYVDG